MKLIERMEQVLTIGDNFPVYEGAEIVIREFLPNEVRPTAKYVLVEKLIRLQKLRDTFDWTRMSDVVEFESGTMAPPVVEFDGEKDCIVDGLHRFTLAKIKDFTLHAIYISREADKDHPIIGFPVEWGELKIRRTQPLMAEECRDLRIPDIKEDLHRCFRDLRFLGSSGRRPRKGQDG